MKLAGSDCREGCSAAATLLPQVNATAQTQARIHQHIPTSLQDQRCTNRPDPWAWSRPYNPFFRSTPKFRLFWRKCKDRPGFSFPAVPKDRASRAFAFRWRRHPDWEPAALSAGHGLGRGSLSHPLAAFGVVATLRRRGDNWLRLEGIQNITAVLRLNAYRVELLLPRLCGMKKE